MSSLDLARVGACVLQNAVTGEVRPGRRWSYGACGRSGRAWWPGCGASAAWCVAGSPGTSAASRASWSSTACAWWAWGPRPWACRSSWKAATSRESSIWMRASGSTRSWASSGQGRRPPGEPIRGPAAEWGSACGQQRWREGAAAFCPKVPWGLHPPGEHPPGPGHLGRGPGQ
ncbi:prostamide/prostaglandin F synthase isoform X3 [Choloepus didactylus]|uniref:prostamide/prostaglandin F synthase isoform X3 n=1 Tax=Choloepus didactylus TaxID=27675 RepID=UPI00189D1DA2|nr:prostamide/prostaglandin F synthase isoform X3 [Choloepus didactylus]